MQPDFLRYGCQMNLPGFNEEKQQLLQDSKVLVVGLGGLGCPAAQYLAAAGTGGLGIADYDVVSVSNLHRQILYTPQEIGLKKSAIASQKLQSQNPGIKVIPHDVKISSENVMQLIQAYDIVVDCTDNFETRYLLNDACVLSGKPLVYGAIYQYEGRLAVWNILNADQTRSPNYRDVFPEVDALQIPNCAEGGVIPTLAGVIGCLQANEVLKYLTKTSELLAGKMMIFDALTLQSRVIKIGRTTKIKITSLVQTKNIPLITASELRKNMANNLYDLIDVRNENERSEFHIGGRHIPANDLDADTINFNGKPVVFYCASGKRSAETVKQLQKKYPSLQVFSLKGGIKAWLENEQD